MAGHASAYDLLGIEPGADQATIERAYKNLIKEHHPDRPGGDSARAAEINRAYRELRTPRPGQWDALEFHDHPFDSSRRGGWLVLMLCAAGAIAAVLFATNSPMAAELREKWSPARAQRLPMAAAAAPVDAMEQPLRIAAIDDAVRSARFIAGTSDEMVWPRPAAIAIASSRIRPT